MVLVLAVACSRQVPTVTIEVRGTPAKDWLSVAAQCLGHPVDWSIGERSEQPGVAHIEVPEHSFADREAKVLTCLRNQPGVTGADVR